MFLLRQQKVELENWVNSIHSACAAAFARHRGKTGTLHLLQEEIFRLEKAIESVSSLNGTKHNGKFAEFALTVSRHQDHKLKNMAELQQSVVTDQDTRHQIQTQILQWEENLERLHCEQFRLRCYMASLQSGELPNPKVRTKTVFIFFSPQANEGEREKESFMHNIFTSISRFVRSRCSPMFLDQRKIH